MTIESNVNSSSTSTSGTAPSSSSFLSKLPGLSGLFGPMSNSYGNIGDIKGGSTATTPSPSLPTNTLKLAPYLEAPPRCMFTAQSRPLLVECFSKVGELCKELKDIDIRVTNHYNSFIEEEKKFQIRAQKILADKHSTEKEIQEILQHEHNNNPNKTAIDELRSLSIKKATQAYEMIEDMITKFDLSKEELLKQMGLDQTMDQDLISKTNFLDSSLFNTSLQSLPEDMKLGGIKMANNIKVDGLGGQTDSLKNLNQNGGSHRNALGTATNIHTDSLQQLLSNENQISVSSSKKGDRKGSSIYQKGIDKVGDLNTSQDNSMYLLGKQSSNASTTTAATTVDPNEPTYCYCGRHYYGTMIGCDGEDECDNEWFHQDCVGLSHLDLENEPLDSWYCDECYERGLAPPDYVKPKIIITPLTAACVVAKYGSN